MNPPIRKRTGNIGRQYRDPETESPALSSRARRSGGGGGSRTHVRRRRDEDRYRLSRRSFSPDDLPPTRQPPGQPPSRPKPGSRRTPGGPARDQPTLVTILLPPVGGDLERIGLPKFPYAARAKLSFAPIGSQDRLTCGPEMHGLLSPPRPTPSKPYRPHESG